MTDIADSGERHDRRPMSRRRFLRTLAVGWTAFAAIATASFAGLVRYFFPNVLFEPPQTFKAGYPSEYTTGEVSTRWKKQYRVWLVRDSHKIYVLSAICTHLGCTPNWLPMANEFKCPCHGSGFRKSGINFEGPAPRPLERFGIQLADDGQILVDKTKSYRYEKAEWNDPHSFLEV